MDLTVCVLVQEQSSFSWDWGPSFPTMGLWKGVRLEAFDILQLIQVSSLPLYSMSHLIFITILIFFWGGGVLSDISRILPKLSVSSLIERCIIYLLHKSGCVGCSSSTHKGMFVYLLLRAPLSLDFCSSVSCCSFLRKGLGLLGNDIRPPVLTILKMVSRMNS